MVSANEKYHRNVNTATEIIIIIIIIIIITSETKATACGSFENVG